LPNQALSLLIDNPSADVSTIGVVPSTFEWQARAQLPRRHSMHALGGREASNEVKINTMAISVSAPAHARP